MKTTPPDPSANSRLEALLALMQRLERLHQELRKALDLKIENMRAARLSDLHACIRREQELTAKIGEQEGLRRQLMVQIGRGFGLSPETARRLSAQRLAERLAEPFRSRFHAVALQLKNAVESVRKVNDLIGRVSTQVLKHLDDVFTAITAPEPGRTGYTPKGQAVPGTGRELFEAIG